jgi:hypothetical protein
VKIVHINVRSLRKNWDIFLQQLGEINIEWEVIIITEINIKKEEIDQYNISGYENHTFTREHTNRGGGIMIFTKATLQVYCKNIDFDENNVAEINIYEQNNKKVKIQIIAIYRRPLTKKKGVYKEDKKYDNKK